MQKKPTMQRNSHVPDPATLIEGYDYCYDTNVELTWVDYRIPEPELPFPKIQDKIILDSNLDPNISWEDLRQLIENMQ
jgi:hypothetical protein